MFAWLGLEMDANWQRDVDDDRVLRLRRIK
jgi:hypothetical protein